MSALEDIFAEVERIQKENARIFYCHPEYVDRVRAAADKILWWPSYWEIQESPFVPMGEIICLDLGAMEKAIKERPVTLYGDNAPPSPKLIITEVGS